MKTVTYDETEWQMVPKVPTEEMKDAAMDILLHHGDIYANSWGSIVIETITPADLLRAMLKAAPTPPADGQAQPVVNQQMTTDSDEDDQTLADTQRAIIEAAEQRGYARAKSECGRDHENAKRYTWLRDHPPKDCQGGMRVRIWGESGDWISISGEKLDVAIDAAWAAKGADHA